MIPLLRDSKKFSVFSRTLPCPDENGETIPIFTESGEALCSVQIVKSAARAESEIIPTPTVTCFTLRKGLKVGDRLADCGTLYEVTTVESHIGADTLTLTEVRNG